ncbi:nucleotide pyrophosphatase [Bifidobacterium sp. SMB2]|uniref:Nucleotide pyrophosphatase n=1 Tax=Bifidobacterium saimiriisciurei TaxID=2661627 RepID=A0ABX0CBP2_9BIFI|nr:MULTISPECIES: alkaline phosphatase family protein [Bifidobacterium]NEG95840.1 nucleotide pyrophosphatase [Bifidobacterium sp. SMB2]NEH12091.1 nucleotide pyrophosphatase [Bifidobacterium saimiriisciurei]
MSVEVPDTSDLLRLRPTVHYDVEADGRGGARHLGAVLPAISDAIGHPTPTPMHPDPHALRERLGLPDAASAIVVLVDGLGYWNIAMRRGHAPYLRSLMGDSVGERPISTCYPSTTVAAMSTFGTGTCPGLTAMTGYTQMNTETGQICQLIQFKDAVEPERLQTQPTIFERLAAQHVRVTSSGLPKFASSPLTMAAFRGADYISNVLPKDRVMAACNAARTPGLTYLYIRDADKTGHNYGWNSDKWIGAFERIDAQLNALRRNAPKGTLIVITADHGMVSSSPEQRIDIATEPQLSRGVAAVGGEPRAVMLYVEEGENPDDVADRWRERLGDLALVRTRSQAVADGVYGRVDDRVLPMIGDVLVSAAQHVTVVDSRIQADKATRLPSVHGSQTGLEMDIPFLVDMA